MTADDVPELPDDSIRTADERQTLVDMVDYYRAVLIRKAVGLNAEQLAVTIGGSNLTLAGLVLHMAIVEDGWFGAGMAGDPDPFFSAIDWQTQPDWEFDEAPSMPWSEIRARFDAAVAKSRAIVSGIDSLDQLRIPVEGSPEASLRWILVHMIEEYARHCGHADLIRQSIDGQVGD